MVSNVAPTLLTYLSSSFIVSPTPCHYRAHFCLPSTHVLLSAQVPNSSTLSTPQALDSLTVTTLVSRLLVSRGLILFLYLMGPSAWP